ncbi:MAG: replicative DNA helicase [Arsenophonus endosymbiont of Ceratovacuna japonica]
MGNKYYKKNIFIDKKDQQIDTLKMPPHSLQAEKSILSIIISNNNNWDYISEKIINEDFFSLSHKTIFIQMKCLFENNKSINIIALSELLEKKGELNHIGGFTYLTELSKHNSNEDNIHAYVSIIRERAIIREIISAANKIANASYNFKNKTSKELIDLAKSYIFQISKKRTNKDSGPKEIEYILIETIEKIKQLYQNNYNGIIGISTGYIDLDEKISGLQNSDLIIIASRPSMGKTTFAMNLCENAALIKEKPVLIFSLEMPYDQIIIRILASLSRVNQSRIRTGQLSNEDWSQISRSMKLLMEKNNIYIDDSSYLTTIDIRYRARRIYREHHGLSLIMIDYLQLIRTPLKYNNRTLEIAEISRSLKSLAKELQIPIIALSQLNRSLEKRLNKKPVNSDLRESGSIEQDADLIIFIYRDEVYHDNTNLKGIAEIIISKYRHGPIGTIYLTFNGKWSRFDNYAKLIYQNR